MSRIAISAFKAVICSAMAICPLHNVLAEFHCPGNVASLPYISPNSNRIVVGVSLNQSGPYNFLLDTGTQMTLVEPSLAAELHLTQFVAMPVVSLGVRAMAPVADVDLFSVGPRSLPHWKVQVYHVENLSGAGPNVRGILGEDFLEQFDTLIDVANHFLCLDDSGTMRGKIKGPQIPLLRPNRPVDGSLPECLVISVRISGVTRPVRLELDSGAYLSTLFRSPGTMPLTAYRSAEVKGSGGSGAQRMFTILPLQTMRIGPIEMDRVQFVSLNSAQEDSLPSDFDGLLSLGLFRRVFIDHAEHFVILDPQ
jgi:hypothetical protein